MTTEVPKQNRFDLMSSISGSDNPTRSLSTRIVNEATMQAMAGGNAERLTPEQLQYQAQLFKATQIVLQIIAESPFVDQINDLFKRELAKEIK